MPPEASDADADAALLALGLADAPGVDRPDPAVVRELTEAAALLALVPPPVPPPPAAWRRLMNSATHRRQHRMTALAVGAATLAAAAAVIATWVASDAFDARDRWRRQAAEHDRTARIAAEDARAARGALREAEDKLAQADLALAPVRAATMTVASFAGSGAGKARVLLDPSSRRWVAVAFELPALDDRDYQLWLVPEGGAPISAGLLRRRSDGVLEIAGAVPPGLAGFRPAISLEPRGGSASPTAIQMVGEPM